MNGNDINLSDGKLLLEFVESCYNVNFIFLRRG